MSIHSDQELAQFQKFVTEQLDRGRQISPEEAVDLWRAENPRPHELTETVDALRAAITDMDNGDHGVTLDEFDRAFRARRGLPPV